jgi:Arc/MetJ-type ribon-helix-helix transcriptional regulator
MANKRASETVRATISLHKVVSEMAEELMRKKGYDNFSAYVAELIRRDKEREEEKQEQRLSGRKAEQENAPEPSPAQTKRKAAS